MAPDADPASTAVAGHARALAPNLSIRSASSSVPNDPWTTYKPIIKRLYIEENKPLREVIHAKSYKRRLKAWGLTKYIKLGAGQDELALQETFPDSTQALATRQRHGYVRLANGRLVDADTVAMHLRRKARSKYSQRNPKFQACPPTVVRAPERFRVLEGVYANVRAYMLGRFDETITVSQDVDTLRAWDPYSGRWLRFSAAVQAACRDNKMNDAIAWMRHAPEELGLLLRNQPSNVLNHFFRFLAQSIRFIDPREPDGAQFLKVVKALIKFGVAYLAQNAARLNLSVEHPLYRLFDSLTRVDDQELLQAAWKSWKIGCQSWYDMMDDPAAWSANIDYLNIAYLGGCSVSELPSNMGDVLDKTVKRYEAEDLHHAKRFGSLWNKAIYNELMSANSSRNLCPKGAPMTTVISLDTHEDLQQYVESMKENVLAIEQEHGRVPQSQTCVPLAKVTTVLRNHEILEMHKSKSVLKQIIDEAMALDQPPANC
ncbi:hypothetical protein J7T55_007125 [Diaporthe amygdali]|uniref:uncharacterized protein n=1 Tax=Phomopsis amygdali TaxID=1214568 RepID=UPI0022FF378C|nr:uncharacterized protein J7T55_007125 [Diaporthe amygdali]KAJ0107913.1 hypothetical protein J7T55_007125 [Diaporthe amygdali]